MRTTLPFVKTEAFALSKGLYGVFCGFRKSANVRFRSRWIAKLIMAK